MSWNWQKDEWPHFYWDEEPLAAFEAQFLKGSGVLIGATKHFPENEKTSLVVEIVAEEAIKTSEIEGEYLSRESVQSSIRRNFGLVTGHHRVQPAERGIADMMTDVFRNFHKPLDHETLFHWHRMLKTGREGTENVGQYRTHEDPMQVVSGRLDKTKVHFEAPPSNQVAKEMSSFLTWWKNSSPNGRHSLPALTRAGIAHLYFVCIHPFEDGNGRIGRALSEKALAEHLGTPTLLALSQTIEKERKRYYNALERNNKDLEITDWLLYFANTTLEAQRTSLSLIDFLIEKAKLFDELRGRLNPRQGKALERMFREGLEGFKGGLSAENYINITGTSRATATRDLQDLVQKGALKKTGKLKSTRYHLRLSTDGE